jgi:hypothetical protein
VRRRFSLGRPGASSYPDAGFARVIRERLNDAGRAVTISDSDYFVTTHPIRKSASTRAYERRERIREDAAACRLGSRQTSRGGLTTKGQGAYAEGSPRCDDHREDREDRRAGRKVQRLDGAYPLDQGDVGIPAREYRETQARWESFCQQIYGAAPLRLVSDHELKRAVLFVFRKRAGPLLITADTRDEWTYQAALDEAMAAVRRDESGTESGFAGLEGAGSTRSR